MRCAAAGQMRAVGWPGWRLQHRTAQMLLAIIAVVIRQCLPGSQDNIATSCYKTGYVEDGGFTSRRCVRRNTSRRDMSRWRARMSSDCTSGLEASAHPRTLLSFILKVQLPLQGIPQAGRRLVI